MQQVSSHHLDTWAGYFAWVRKWQGETEIIGFEPLRVLGLRIGLWGGDLVEPAEGPEDRWDGENLRLSIWLSNTSISHPVHCYLSLTKKSYCLLWFMLTWYIHFPYSFSYLFKKSFCVFIFLGWDNMSFSLSDLLEAKRALQHSTKKGHCLLYTVPSERYYSIMPNAMLQKINDDVLDSITLI